MTEMDLKERIVDFVAYNLPVLKKERIGSCVPLYELHLFATSCYKNRSYRLVSAMFSAAVCHS